MSLVERALEKARSEAEKSTESSGSRRGPTFVPPVNEPEAPLVQRVAAKPQLKLDDEFLQRTGLRAPPEQVHQQLAEYRHVKRQLLDGIHLQGEAELSRVVLVTSAMAGEGKTFSAANLALSLALEPDYSVLLIDADVIRPAMSRLFGLEEKPGLMEAVLDPAIDPESLIVTTSIEGLSILPAGTEHPNATELFASARMAQVIHALRAPRNRIIVLDSLPLLLTTEARTLLLHAGQVLLVVRADFTPQNAVMQALELLEDHEHVKLLLNAIVHSRIGQYYGNGYGYQYTYRKQLPPAQMRASMRPYKNRDGKQVGRKDEKKDDNKAESR